MAKLIVISVMVRDAWHMIMAGFMKVIGMMIEGMARAMKSIIMAIIIMGNFMRAGHMGRACIAGLQGKFMMESGTKG